MTKEYLHKNMTMKTYNYGNPRRASHFVIMGKWHCNYQNGKMSAVCSVLLQQTIKSRSGHRSDAVRVYKRPSTEHQIRVSNALQPPRPQAIPATVSKPPQDTPHPSSTPATVSQPDHVDVPTTKQVKTDAKEDPTESTLTLHVPSCIKTVVNVQNGRKVTFQI